MREIIYSGSLPRNNDNRLQILKFADCKKCKLISGPSQCTKNIGKIGEISILQRSFEH